MNSEILMKCCGAVGFSNFGGTRLNGDVSPGVLANDSINKWLDKKEAYFRDIEGTGVAIVILNNEQFEKFGELFKVRGYEVSKPSYNPKHRTALYVLMKILHELPEDWEALDEDDSDHGTIDLEFRETRRKAMAAQDADLITS